MGVSETEATEVEAEVPDETEAEAATATEDEPKTDVSTSTTTDEAAMASKAEAQRKKYRLITGEEILENGEARPSTLAFLGLYFLGFVVLMVHMLFAFGVDSNDNSSTLVKVVSTFISLTDSETVPIGFVLVMGIITWFNRMLNVSTSGRWVTIALLVATLMPVIIQLDDILTPVIGLFNDTYDGVIGFTYDYFLFGVIFAVVFWGATWKYQRSFSYAVTSNAIIFQHAFLLSRSHRRILFDRISEVMVERTPMGTMLGYATLTIMTDSGIGLTEETVSTSVGSAPAAGGEDEGAAAKAGRSIFKKFFAVLSYQRTTRTVDHDPKHCFYKIRKWENVKMMLNEMHRKHSSSNLLEDIAERLASEDSA